MKKEVFYCDICKDKIGEFDSNDVGIPIGNKLYTYRDDIEAGICHPEVIEHQCSRCCNILNEKICQLIQDIRNDKIN